MEGIWQCLVRALRDADRLSVTFWRAAQGSRKISGEKRGRRRRRCWDSRSPRLGRPAKSHVFRCCPLILAHVGSKTCSKLDFSLDLEVLDAALDAIVTEEAAKLRRMEEEASFNAQAKQARLRSLRKLNVEARR